jgi:hypothetical protein
VHRTLLLPWTQRRAVLSPAGGILLPQTVAPFVLLRRFGAPASSRRSRPGDVGCALLTAESRQHPSILTTTPPPDLPNQHESYAYTEVDETVLFGVGGNGKRWKRKLDRVGVAFVSNGISRVHQEYLALGGDGFILGDGKLKPRAKF